LICAFGAAVAALTLTASGADPARDRLRSIVQQQCLPLWRAEHRPDPCVSVHLSGQGPELQGYALLHDRKGGAHFLLIPLQTISGIESAELERDALNYFDAAWRARGVLARFLGRPIGRSSIGTAINSIRARSQDQLHIHIACLDRMTYAALHANADRIGSSWSEFSLNGRPYQALRIMGHDLDQHDPLKMLAQRLSNDPAQIGQYTVLVAGMEFEQGAGFAVLASASARGAELLLDSACRIAE
jgi:CDP-diacylglycerol pyrophosphatase